MIYRGAGVNWLYLSSKLGNGEIPMWREVFRILGVDVAQRKLFMLPTFEKLLE
jgi:hypothetical protein